MSPSAVREFLGAEPVAFFITLCAIVALVFRLAETRAFAKVFDVLPTVFWIYFVPMLLATLGFFPAESPIYGLLTDYLLPASLVLLILSASLPEIARLGPVAIGILLVGTCGIILGSAAGVLALMPFFKAGILPEAHLDSLWKGVAALSGSWTGGSSNMAAIWGSLTASNSSPTDGQIFAAMVAIDVCIGYSWMAIVIALAGRQNALNRWLKADTRHVEEVNRRVAQVSQEQARPTATNKILYMLAMAFVIAFACRWMGIQIQGVLENQIESALWRSIFGHYGIMIILVTLVSLGLSLTPVARLESYGASKLGYALLYIVLARIGAKGDLNAIREFPAYLIMGVVWIAVHGVLLISAAKAFRIPIFFAATASQANVGGPVSAPVVAVAYQPGLAVVGLLLAILGGLVGTFSGLFVVAPMIHFLTDFLRI